MSRFGGRLRGSQAVSGWLRGGGGGVSSVQRNTITIASGATSNTATLSPAVDVSRSRIVFLGLTDAGGDTTVDKSACRVALTDGTTVTATVGATGTGNRIVAFEVIEYRPGVIWYLKRGTITTTAATSGTDTVAVADTTKATTDYLGFTSDFSGAAVPGNSQCRVVLTNATTVTATGLGGLNRTVGYQVVEFY